MEIVIIVAIALGRVAAMLAGVHGLKIASVLPCNCGDVHGFPFHCYRYRHSAVVLIKPSAVCESGGFGERG